MVLRICYSEVDAKGNAMNGRGLVVAIVSVGIGLGGLILNSQRTTNQAIGEVQDDIAELRNDMDGLRDRMGGLEQRMARLEGLFEGFTKRETTP